MKDIDTIRVRVFLQLYCMSTIELKPYFQKDPKCAKII